MSKYASLGTAIKTARVKRRWTQDQLAFRVGAKGGRFTVIRWETGLHKPTEFAPQLIAELGLDESLFDDEEDSSLSLTRDLHAAIDRIVEARVAKAVKS
jgi:transcriptional regulator with XRE-family HTH domain